MQNSAVSHITRTLYPIRLESNVVNDDQILHAGGSKSEFHQVKENRGFV